MRISTGKGEWLRQRMRRYNFGEYWLGVNCRCVSYADHRSGTSALRMIIGLWWWYFDVQLLKWNTRLRAPERILSLREVLEAGHPVYKDDNE